MSSVANTFFTKMRPDKKNAEILKETLEIARLREDVVKRLKLIEEADSEGAWWEDKELMSLFKNLYDCGIIVLPQEPVERLRWIALLCVEICTKEGFAYGNLIIPPDYLPDEKLGEYEDLYGITVIEEIVKLRKQLARRSK